MVFIELEDESVEIKHNETTGIATGAVTTPKLKGRPKTKPESRQTSMHLPLALLERLELEAENFEGGNKSRMLVKILEKYFLEKDCQ